MDGSFASNGGGPIAGGGGLSAGLAARLGPGSASCATVLYGGILEQVRDAGYDVLGRRVSVPLRRRAAVAGPALVRARRARRRQPA